MHATRRGIDGSKREINRAPGERYGRKRMDDRWIRRAAPETWWSESHGGQRGGEGLESSTAAAPHRRSSVAGAGAAGGDLTPGLRVRGPRQRTSVAGPATPRGHPIRLRARRPGPRPALATPSLRLPIVCPASISHDSPSTLPTAAKQGLATQAARTACPTVVQLCSRPFRRLPPPMSPISSYIPLVKQLVWSTFGSVNFKQAPVASREGTDAAEPRVAVAAILPGHSIVILCHCLPSRGGEDLPHIHHG